MVTDRRKRRALSPVLATEHYLEAELERCDATALFLLDDGEVVASMVRDGERFDREGALRLAMGVTPDDRDLYAHVLDVAGKSMLFASIGARVRSVRAVERSIDRIFKA
ncbi:MAG: hypothetical protein JNL21_18950 [Myxococcales bacterium]|jgi:hypothetical protein|nr:hypothetical protein [Myxococcales bacterium]